MFLFVTPDDNKNLGVPEIVGKANVSHGYHREPWVFEFIADNLRDLLTKYVCNSLWATHFLNQEQEAGAGGR
jgi:hypothetical protein